MRKSNKISRGSPTNGSMGMGSKRNRRRGTDVEFPEFRRGRAGALEDDSVLIPDGDSGSREGDVATGIAELTNAE